MWLLIILLILLLIIIGLLVMPLELEINTPLQVYELRVGRIFSAGIKLDENSAGIVIKITGWQKYISILPPKQAHGEKVKKKKRIKPRRANAPEKKGIKHLSQRILAVLKSFKIKQLEADIDTNDFVTNAYLYPVFYMVKLKTGKNIQINFNGQIHLVLHIRNNLFRMGRAFIWYK